MGGGLDQYGPECYRTAAIWNAGTEGVNGVKVVLSKYLGSIVESA